MAAMTTSGGVAVEFEVTGHGPPLVLVHGITESRRSWDPLIGPLAAGHTVLAVDLRGHGQSGAGERYDLDSMAADVHDVVDALGWGAPVLVGR